MKTLGTGAAQLYFKFQIGSYRQITFDFNTDISGWTFELFLKRFKGDRLKTISLTSGAGLSYPVYSSTEIVATFSITDTSIEEGEYYIELRRTDLGIAIISRLAYFSFDAPDGDDLSNPLEFTLGNSTVEVTVSNGSSSTGLTFADWDASTDLAPAGVANTLYTAQNNSVDMIMPDGNIVTAGIVAIAKVSGPGLDITDKDKWMLLSSIWGTSSNTPQLVSLTVDP